MTIRAIAGAVLFTVTVAAQAVPEFEVASIRPAVEQVQQASVGVRISGSQVRITYFSLKDYIALAYRQPIGQISGPDWLAQERFDIAGKLPDGASSAQVSEMLQKLLADRFELKIHRESRELPVYELTIARAGLKLKESAPSPDDPLAPGTVNVAGAGSAAGFHLDLGGGSSFAIADNRVTITRATTTNLAETLTRLMDRRVIDVTGLTGHYDMAFELTPDDYTAILIRSAVNAGVVLPPQALRALDLAASDPFSNGLQKFGLTLESRKSPLDVIIVDSMLKAPLEN